MKRQLLLLTGFCLLALNISQAQDYLIQANYCFDRGEYDCAKRNYGAYKLQTSAYGMDEKIGQCDKCLQILTSANLLFSQKDFSKAKDKYEELLAINPKDPHARTRIEICNNELTTPKSLYEKGTISYDQGKYAEAIEWFRKAAEQGYAEAQNDLGYMYRSGEGVTQNYAEAVRWYARAAEQGHTTAQNNLGNMYYNGYGVNKDYAEALKLYRKAADKGNEKAQFNMGNMYFYGLGVTRDNVEALKWFIKAAEQNDMQAQNTLGFMYENGNGAPKDRTEAIRWYTRAAAQGSQNARTSLTRLTGSSK